MVRNRLAFVCIAASFVSLAFATPQPCDFAEPLPPANSCSCEKGSMFCKGAAVTSFPLLNNPSSITAYTFEECLLGNVSDVPYEFAVSFTMEKCPFTTVGESAFRKLSQVKHLTLNGKCLVNVSKFLFSNLTALTSLELRNNPLAAFPDGVFDAIPKLEKLDLSDNNLQSTEKLFGSPSSTIVDFECEGCNMTAIPTELLTKLTKLKNLNLNRNNFDILSSDSFSFLRSLEKLSLDQCNIEVFTADTFSNLSFIVTLNLGNNKIEHLPQKLFSPFFKSLKELYLEGNQFKTMYEDRAPWNNLTELKLGHNPWLCDCLIDWMHTYKLDKIDKENVTCFSPEEYKGQNLFTIEASLLCGSHHGNSAIVLGIAIPVILICLALIGYYVHQIVRNRRRREHQRHSFKYRSVYGDTVESNSKQSILS